MYFSSYILVILIAFALFVLGVIFVRNIHKKTHRRREIRKQLLAKIESSRLPKILQALGIGFANYFNKVSIEEIDKCITTCETCQSTELCEEKVKIPELNPSDIEFCPNQQHLSQYSRSTRVRG